MNEKKRCAPEYPAIANKLKQEILNGTFNNKDKLFPSENSLAQKYNVSRATLRKALEILKNEGLIEKSQGKRVQITLSKLKRTSWNFSSFSEGLRAMHDEPYSRVDVNEIVQGVYIVPDKAQYDDITGLCLENHWMEEILTI